jgi:hypothetical protein
VKDYLVSLGVPAGRVTVISKGKEQPFCNEESESCWQPYGAGGPAWNLAHFHVRFTNER